MLVMCYHVFGVTERGLTPLPELIASYTGVDAFSTVASAKGREAAL